MTDFQQLYMQMASRAAKAERECRRLTAELQRATDDERLLGTAAVAALLSVSEASVHRWLKRGEFVQPIRLGGCLRWRRGDVLDWVERRRGEP